jgi:hypothetical protein
VFIKEVEHIRCPGNDGIPVTTASDFVVFVGHVQFAEHLYPSSRLRHSHGLIGVAVDQYHGKIAAGTKPL